MENDVTVALFALVISVFALIATIIFIRFSREHNKNSVKPLPYLAPSDYESKIAVRLWNYGCGPMVLNSVVAKDKRGGLSGHLIDLVPPPPSGLYFRNFVQVKSGRPVPPTDSITLIEFVDDDKNIDAVRYLEKLRDFLGNLDVEVSYTDIYKSIFPIYKRGLNWFHRGKE